VISAAVLIVAEFLTLYAVRVIHGTSRVPPVAAGTENHYALIPIAILAVALILAAIRVGDRWALAAVAILGLIALLIGLLHDLPDARRAGLVGSLHAGWVRGASSPSVGMYMETLGAVLLLLTAGVGMLFGEPIAAEPMAPPKPGGASGSKRPSSAPNGGSASSSKRVPSKRTPPPPSTKRPPSSSKMRAPGIPVKGASRRSPARRRSK
jgi:hypothetical protein